MPKARRCRFVIEPVPDPLIRRYRIENLDESGESFVVPGQQGPSVRRRRWESVRILCGTCPDDVGKPAVAAPDMGDQSRHVPFGTGRNRVIETLGCRCAKAITIRPEMIEVDSRFHVVSLAHGGGRHRNHSWLAVEEISRVLSRTEARRRHPRHVPASCGRLATTTWLPRRPGNQQP